MKNYCVTLEEGLVERAKVQAKISGSKLSPVLGVLLKQWVEQKEINGKQQDGRQQDT